MSKTKKNNKRCGLSLSIGDSRTGRKSHIAIRITNPTLQLILDQETRNHEKSNKANKVDD